MSMNDVLSNALDKAWDEVTGDAGKEFHWLKALLFGQFDPEDQDYSVIIATMIACLTVPGTVIVTSSRDAIAVIMRLSKAYEAGEDLLADEHLMDWMMLAACLLALALPVAAAAAGAAVAGVGVVVTGVIGAEAATLLRALMFLLLESTELKLERILLKLNECVKGNVFKLTKSVTFDKYIKPLIDFIKAVTDKIVALARCLIEKLSHAKVFNVTLAEHVEALQKIVVRLESWERGFYAIQQQALNRIPKAMAELQLRLDKVLLQKPPQISHNVASGIAAEKVVPSLPEKAPVQYVHDPTGKAIREWEATQKNRPQATGSEDIHIQEQPAIPASPESKSNVKIEETRPNLTNITPHDNVKTNVYHRRPRDSKEFDLVEKSQEVHGQVTRNYMSGLYPKVKAYEGPLPEGKTGYEFTTDVLPDAGCVPKQPTWSGDRPGVITDGEWAHIKVTITKIVREQ